MKRSICILFSFLFATNLFSQVVTAQGPFEPATVTEQYAGCLACPGNDWMNFLNAANADSQYAVVELREYPFCFQSSCYHSRALLPHNYGFTIPGNAVLLGIRVDVFLRTNKANAVVDSLVQLYVNTSSVGINKANANFWPVSSTWVSYGDSTDLWGASLSPADINSNSFGILFTPMNKSTTASDSALVDDVRMTVWYQPVLGINENRKQSDSFDFIYNRSDKSITIKNNYSTGMATLKIHSITGKMEKSVEVNLAKESKINTELCNGIYIVTIVQTGFFFTKKIVVIN